MTEKLYYYSKSGLCGDYPLTYENNKNLETFEKNNLNNKSLFWYPPF
jgi:hypothetical protein